MDENDGAGENKDIEHDFANVVRLVANESYDDVRMLLAKLVRKYRTRRPAFAELINQSLRASRTRSAGPSILRRNTRPGASDSALPVDEDSRMSLVRVFDDLLGLDAPLLPPELLGAIENLVRERRERARLIARGVRPTRSAVLVGPPGVGKTLSARWIAAQLGKPLWVLDLTTVMSSLLGKTGNNIRTVFDHAKGSEAILLLDEIDAIAKRRSDESDVGELKRLVTGILQEVDSWPDAGLLLAATNHPELVDPALWRRFDVILQFDATLPATIELAVRRFLGTDGAAFESVVPLLAASLRGNSVSEVERAVQALRRQIVLDGGNPNEIVVRMAEKNIDRLDKPMRLKLALELARGEVLSYNKITALTGVSRDTIRKHAGPSHIKGRGVRKVA
jgi:hypothetical protein